MFAFIVSIFSKESCMWLVAIAWIYVVGLMAATEIIEHSIVAGIMTFLGYCVFPLSIVWYIAGSKMRRMKIAQKEEMARRLRAGRQPQGPAGSGERERHRSSRDNGGSDDDGGYDNGDSGGGDGGGSGGD
ncbi:hypothetical protein INH39_26060 [Massilia violaceinigra]|uniref:Uncharacterized protein n=1 Tax=Massilia violaceinigra TaxID=2045208 RepID=A0ABY4AHR7_9BURK|nr:hypothetical protein [Massilia violaceinigra]UOD33690.1 hypothetical protein INH39_26060 [Massilia violaceinigra]